MQRAHLLGAAALFACAGCGINTDPTIFVDATVTKPAINVVIKPAVTDLTGGFTMTLHLGARAAGSSKIDLQGFQLVSEDQNTVEADSLPLKAPGRTFPITIDPDTTEDVEVQIDYGTDGAAADTGKKLCTFGTARFRGSITDSLRGGQIPVLTDPVTVKGCATP